jgi:hypothetical protein
MIAPDDLRAVYQAALAAQDAGTPRRRAAA